MRLIPTPLVLFVTGATMFLASVALPLGVSQINRFLAKPLPREPRILNAPTIDVVIPSYLESTVINSKIASTRRALDHFPSVSRIIVVASDDATAAAAQTADLVLRVPRAGKAAASNAGISVSTADIIVLTDANCEVEPASWPREAVHALQSADLVSANKSETAGHESMFWRLERRLKRGASGKGESLAVAGEFMAFRRADYREIPSSLILDDLAIALDFHERGLTVTVPPEITTTEPAAVGSDQITRRRRITRGLFNEALPLLPQLIRTPAGRMFAAHKLYRVTLGAVGFWLATLSMPFVLPPIGAAATAVVVYCATTYCRGVRPLCGLGWLSSIAGLQTIPLLAAWDVLRLRTPSDGTWAKVKR